MNLPELGIINEYTRIPKILFSTDTGKPFQHCLMCNRFLLEDGTGYLIEKAIKQHPEFKIKEVIFEYAICLNCSMKMNAAMSEESRQRLAAYFTSHTNMATRRQDMLNKKRLRIQPWISRCLIKNTPISKTREFQVVAQCDGKHMLFTYMPFALSSEAMDEVAALLSEKTLGEMDDFMGKYFSGPPEVAEIFKKRLILI